MGGPAGWGLATQLWSRCGAEGATGATGSDRARPPEEEEELAPEEAEEDEEAPLFVCRACECEVEGSNKHCPTEGAPSRAEGEVDVLVLSSAVRRKNECCSAW